MLSLLALLAGTALAQDDRENLRFGLKAGINVSNVYDEQGDDFVADPKLGFVGGGFLSIPIGKYLGVQPEVLYSQKGFRSSGSFLGLDYQATRTLGFLDIPLYVQFKPAPQLTIMAGPQYSFLLHRTDRFESDVFDDEQQEDFENDNIRKNILGVATGIDVNMNRFVLGLRGAWDLQHNNGDGTSDSPRYKNVLFQATLGAKF